MNANGNLDAFSELCPLKMKLEFQNYASINCLTSVFRLRCVHRFGIWLKRLSYEQKTRRSAFAFHKIPRFQSVTLLTLWPSDGEADLQCKQESLANASTNFDRDRSTLEQQRKEVTQKYGFHLSTFIFGFWQETTTCCQSRETSNLAKSKFADQTMF